MKRKFFALSFPKDQAATITAALINVNAETHLCWSEDEFFSTKLHVYASVAEDAAEGLQDAFKHYLRNI